MIRFTDRGIPLQEEDKVAIYSDKNKYIVGTIEDFKGNTANIITDKGDKLKVNILAGRIVAEMKKNKKFTDEATLKDIKPYVKDFGGELQTSIKVKDIKQPISINDIIFIWNNKQAIPRKVKMIRLQNKGAILILENNDGIQYLFKENFDRIIGIYNSKQGKIDFDDRISIKELLPYLKSYNRTLTRQISGDNFIDPIMSDYANDILIGINNNFRKLKIKKSDLKIKLSNYDEIVIGFPKEFDETKMKSIIHYMWTQYGNIFNMESNYPKYQVTVTKKDENTSDGEIRKILKYVTEK